MYCQYDDGMDGRTGDDDNGTDDGTEDDDNKTDDGTEDADGQRTTMGRTDAWTHGRTTTGQTDRG